MVELSDPQKEFLAMAEAFETIVMRGNVKKLFGGKREAVEHIKDLEEKGLIDRVAYGKWRLTREGEEIL